MQQGVNNRWLSQELIATAKAQAENDRARSAVLFADDFQTRGKLQSTRQGHRRMWQHLATGLLLVASAAFSYLAWSQTEGLSKAPPALSSPQALLSTPLDSQRQRVNTLRVANRELQLRIAALHKAVNSP